MRRRPKRERGQSALLAVVGLVILAIGMYTSYNLSRAVYEKIQLQNAADATAYSLATLEARTFNFIAFANRAQVANYVQMMESQSILSSSTFVEGLTAWGGDFVLALADLCEMLASFPYLDWLRSVAAILEPIGQALEAAYDNLMQPMLDEANPVSAEVWTPRFIQMQTVENCALFAVSALMALTTMMQLGDGGRDIALANDPDARLTWLSYALNSANLISYGAAFDPATLKMCGSNTLGDEAKRLITEMAHGARVGSTGGHEPFIVARPPGDTLAIALDAMLGQSGRDDRAGRRARSLMAPFVRALEALVPNFVGTGKLLTVDGGDLPDLDDTGERSAEHSGLARGESIAAKDTTKREAISFFPRWGEFASVISTASQGRHCRYTGKPSGYGQWQRIVFGRIWSGDEFECRKENRHVWRALIGRGGVQPYLKFSPGTSGLSSERTSFNQPDVWVSLNKEPSTMGMKPTGDLQIDYRDGSFGGRQYRLDARIGQDMDGPNVELALPDGMNVVARAQVYYHRPGAWKEPPNFFNPFWGARLAPKNVGIKRVLADLELSADLSQLIADNVWMH